MTRLPDYGSTLSELLAALERLGPSTLPMLHVECRSPRDSLRKACNRLIAEPPATRRIRIVNWVREASGERTYLRAVYALGPGSNKKRPGPKPRNEVVRDYYRRKQAECGFNAFGPLLSQKQAVKVAAAKRRERLI